MKKIITQHFILFSTFILVFLIGLIYVFNLKKQYTSTSQVVIFRQKVENPDISSDELSNRWIWIRDGLNQKSALITEELLTSISSRNYKLPDKNKDRNETLKKFINIQFTGADENNFIIEVTSPDPYLSFDLNQALFKRLKHLAVDSYEINFNKIIDKLNSKKNELKNKAEESQFYEEKIKKMNFNHIIEQEQRKHSFEITKLPKINLTPNKSIKVFLLISICLIGIIFGFFLEFIYFNFYGIHD